MQLSLTVSESSSNGSALLRERIQLSSAGAEALIVMAFSWSESPCRKQLPPDLIYLELLADKENEELRRAR